MTVYKVSGDYAGNTFKQFVDGQDTNADVLETHKSDNTPHLDANGTHNWGFRVNEDKSVTMLFSEVSE